MRGIPVEVDGVVFNSVKDAAEHYGINKTTVARRLREGWPPDEAFEITLHKRPAWSEDRSYNLVTLHGTFRTIGLAASHFGLKPATLAKRLADGWPIDEAVGILPRIKKAKETTAIACAGKDYPNIQSLADAFGLRYTRVYKRISSGWSPEQAVEIEVAPPRFRDASGNARDSSWKSVQIIDSKSYPLCPPGEYKLYVVRNNVNGQEYIGITTSDLRTRLRGHRASAQRGDNSKLYNAMRKYGQKSFIIELIRNDATNFAELQQQEVEEINRRETQKNGYNISAGGEVGTSIAIKIDGVYYPSRSAAAAHFGIDASVFNLRLTRLGWTPEQAAELGERRPYGRHNLIVSGLPFSSLQAAAEHFGVDYKLAFSRVTRGKWSVEEALEIKKRGSLRFRGKPVVAFAKEYLSISQCARENRVSLQALYRRLNHHGEDVETAIKRIKAQDAN